MFMYRTTILMKKVCVLALFLISTGIATAYSTVFTVKQGDPLILLQEKKTASFEIDYSQMMVTEGKDHDYDLPFREWMITRDEDGDKWLKDWEEKDSIKCNGEFRDKFNDEVEKAIKLTKVGKDYHLILRFDLVDFGGSVKWTPMKGISGGTAEAEGELKLLDKKTNEELLILGFNKLKGEDSFKQIGRLIGLFENLGEDLNEYLKDYQKQLKKQNKKKK